jgi:vancomycin permeability regulator SanA
LIALVSARESVVFLLWSAWWGVGARALLAVGVGAALLWAFKTKNLGGGGSRLSKAARWGCGAALLLGVGWALRDAVEVWRAAAAQPDLALSWVGRVPWSLTWAAVLGWSLWGALRSGEHAPPNPRGLDPAPNPRDGGVGDAVPHKKKSLLRLALRGAAVGAVLLLMVLHHVLAVAGTDWRREGDCAVVLGAAVRDNGRPSDALRDRVHTAAKLYRQGKVRRLLMTGGTGPNGRSEPQAMRDLAVSYGVPASAILLDEGGHNTAASLHNLVLLDERHQLGRLLVVSHGHHTARIRLGCHRLGLVCATVPAEQERVLRKEPWFVTREVLGFAAYVVVFR